MPYQLLLRNHSSGTMAELFTRGKCLTFASAPFVVGCEEGFPTGVCLSFREEGGEILVCNDGTCEVRCDERILPQGTECVLKHGNVLLFGEKELRFYRLHGRPGVSMTANLIGYLAIFGIVFSLLMELGSVVRLPYLLKNSSVVRKQVAVQELIAKADAVRIRLNNKELHASVQRDSIAVAYLDALHEEMEKRTRYLRANVDILTEQERQEQLENLDRIDKILDRLAANPAVSPQIPEVKIDDPVRHLIEEK